jgi:ABC-type multidrug transport system ATPase subunit
VLGQPVDETDPASRAAIASVLDDIDFFPDLSVFEHLELMAYTHATPDPVEVVDEISARSRWNRPGISCRSRSPAASAAA